MDHFENDLVKKFKENYNILKKNFHVISGYSDLRCSSLVNSWQYFPVGIVPEILLVGAADMFFLTLPLLGGS
jgi:hypothetical protein